MKRMRPRIPFRSGLFDPCSIFLEIPEPKRPSIEEIGFSQVEVHFNITHPDFMDFAINRGRSTSLKYILYKEFQGPRTNRDRELSKEMDDEISEDLNALVTKFLPQMQIWMQRLDEPSADVQNIAVKLSCRHTFHRSCLLQWLSKHGTCPNCRHIILEIPPRVFFSDDEERAIRPAALGVEEEEVDWVQDRQEEGEVDEIDGLQDGE